MRKIKKTRWRGVLVCLWGLSFAMPSEAVDIVSDPGEMMQTILVLVQLEQQFAQLKEQFTELQSQTSELKEANAAMSGQYGFGDWENDEAMLHTREWAPDNWQTALKGLSGGSAARYQELLKQYSEAHPNVKDNVYAAATDTRLAQAHHNQVAANRAGGALSSYEFERVRKHIQALHALGQQIEDATKNKDIKAAMDLNSRIQLEVGFIATEELRMQTVLNQQSAAQQAKQIAMQNEAALFNNAGDN